MIRPHDKIEGAIYVEKAVEKSIFYAQDGLWRGCENKNCML